MQDVAQGLPVRVWGLGYGSNNAVAPHKVIRGIHQRPQDPESSKVGRPPHPTPKSGKPEP